MKNLQTLSPGQLGVVTGLLMLRVGGILISKPALIWPRPSPSNFPVTMHWGTWIPNSPLVHPKFKSNRPSSKEAEEDEEDLMDIFQLKAEMFLIY